MFGSAGTVGKGCNLQTDCHCDLVSRAAAVCCTCCHANSSVVQPSHEACPSVAIHTKLQHCGICKTDIPHMVIKPYMQVFAVQASCSLTNRCIMAKQLCNNSIQIPKHYDYAASIPYPFNYAIAMPCHMWALT